MQATHGLYTLAPETKPSTLHTSKGPKTIWFGWRIDRPDGSLVYRTETKKYAQEILDRLNEVPS